MAVEAQVYRRLHPREYLRRFLSQSLRPDGRSCSGDAQGDGARKATVTCGSINTAVGSAMLKLGHTTVVAGVNAYLEPPLHTQPSDAGTLDARVEIVPLASFRSRQAPTDAAPCLTDLVRSVLLPHVDLRDLCVEKEELVWNLVLTIYCVHHDGNLEDAVVLAALAALQNVRLPTVTMVLQDSNNEHDETMDADSSQQPAQKDDEIIATVSESRTAPLKLDGYPLVVSFALFEEYALLDPSLEEEQVSDGRVTFVMNPSGQLRGVLKPGGPALSQVVFNTCLQQAKQRVVHLVKLLNHAP